MDSGSVTASGRGYEPSKQQKSNEGQELISNLPDFIIGRILSFLATKDAVRTSVLSQRWRYMWTFVTELSFKDRECFSAHKIRKTSFIHFVYRVLLRLNSTNIDSCSLFISEKYDSSHVNEWISVVLNLRIKKLCVYSLKEIPLSSHSLFQCNSLMELVLYGCPLRVPTFVFLSSLTILKLSGITVTCTPSNESEALTLNFLVLRKYETENCTWSGVKSVTLQVPLLKVLSMDYGKFVKSNAEFKICVSHLTQFCYIGPILSEAILLDAHIASANITLYNSKKSVQETRLFVSKLLSINANCLKLYLRTQKVLARVKHSFPDIPALEMLGHLDLAFVTGEFLLGLLIKSPSLETLVLKVQDFGEELANSAILPSCFLFTLKVVKFVRFAGNKHELCFAKYVLENALVLERITFSRCQGQRSLNKWEKVKEKLSSYKSSFSSVTIEFLS